MMFINTKIYIFIGFYKEINLIINNIGEDVIKEHLQKMFIYVRESND